MSRHTKVIVVEEIEETENEARNFNSVQIETKIQKSPPVSRKNPEPPQFQKGKSGNTLSPNIMDLDPTSKKSSKMDQMMGNGEQKTGSSKLKAIADGDMVGAGGIFGAEPEDDPAADQAPKKMPKMMGGGKGEMVGAGGIFGAEPEDDPPADQAPKKMPKMMGGGGGGMKAMVKKKMALANTVNKVNKAFLQIAEDSKKGIEDTLLYETLKPLFILMKIFGLFFARRKSPLNLHHRLRSFRKVSFEQVWCTVLLLILTLNFLRSMTTFIDADFSSFDSTLFFKILVVIFFYETCSRAALAYRACYKEEDGLESLFNNIESVCYPDKIIPYESALNRTQWMFIVLTFVLSLCNVASITYGVYFATPEVQALFDAYLAPFPPSVPGVEAWEAFVVLMTFINVQVAMLSLTFFTVICYMLDKEFEYSRRIFRLKIKDDGTFGHDLEKFRINHQKRCNLVEEADGLFKEYIANTYTTNVPLLCLLVYSVINSDITDISYRVISAFGTIYVLLQFFILSIAATLINIKAHAPLGDIYGIKVVNTTPERSLEVSMFLNKLTGTEIGLTAWDMFVINKPTILTMIGMILTYFFLLLQFSVSPTEPTTGNCTCMLEIANGTNLTLISV